MRLVAKIFCRTQVITKMKNDTAHLTLPPKIACYLFCTLETFTKMSVSCLREKFERHPAQREDSNVQVSFSFSLPGSMSLII